MTSFTLRFDDLRPSRRRGFALGDVDRILSADRVGDVPEVLDEADSAVAAGHWVGGWVGYEAAPAFDPTLRVLELTDTAFESLPLVWLAVSRHRRAVPATTSGAHRLGEWQALTTETQHRRAVEAIRRRIEAGDTYQVNHTFLLEADFAGDAAAFYQRLVRSQSCGYGSFIDTGDWVVASASPELFFEWRNGVLTCRPMKGTVRRGRDTEEDHELRAWLEASEKNRAENVMIVDMVRNDLGRIAEIGSVEVPALFDSEKYDTLWQLTSTVTARPRPGTGLVDVFEALFPSASITGAPKVSTMGIISQLESHPRGVYCGAIGFGGPGPEGPEWAFNVGIRTVLIDRRKEKAYYGTGGGITYDSEPADEYAEARLKAEVLGRTQGELKLLETTRWDPHLGARHLDRHLRRAATSAGYFDIPFDPAEVRASIARAVKGRSGPARIRILIDREGWVSVEVGDLAPDSGPVRLAIDDRPIDRNSPFLYHKTTIRDAYTQASARHPDADDVVMWNEADEVTETTIGNLALRIDGEWFTPPINSGLLAGTERAARLAAGELAERVLTLADLDRAEAVARLNSVRGWEECELMAPGGAGGRW
jgi:para-aminobenzoate synthetase / 4-amino-4-deoxychorismate lyase